MADCLISSGVKKSWDGPTVTRPDADRAAHSHIFESIENSGRMAASSGFDERSSALAQHLEYYKAGGGPFIVRRGVLVGWQYPLRHMSLTRAVVRLKAREKPVARQMNMRVD